MQADRDALPPASGPLIRVFRPHRRRATPGLGWVQLALYFIVACLALAAAGPLLLHLIR